VNDTPRASPASADAPALAVGELFARYQRELVARDFHSDPAQLGALLRLDELRERLMSGAAATRPQGRQRWWRALVTGRRRPPPRGLYLWGGVGRGKTWLMDLFYDSLPFAERRRRHFHRFMHDVHAGLAQLKHTRAPLDRVAARLAAEARILCFDELYVADIADAMILGALFEG